MGQSFLGNEYLSDSKEIPCLIEPEGSLLCTRELATAPKPDTEDINPHLTPYFTSLTDININTSCYVSLVSWVTQATFLLNNYI
jgi:hypothetical protein